MQNTQYEGTNDHEKKSQAQLAWRQAEKIILSKNH